MNVVIIPARGGSKRIPGKNIRMFHGKPMLAWSIQTAMRAECFDRIVVSTDDDAIAEVASAAGAEVPFLRPATLAGDHATTGTVVRHALETLFPSESLPDAVCCLYATAPFARPEDLGRARNLLLAGAWDFTFPVTSFSSPIQRAIRLGPQGETSMFYPAQFERRSQDLEPAFHDAGQFYWGRSRAWIDELPIFNSRSLALRIPPHRVQDIDTEEDWRRAEILFRILLEEGET